MAKKSEEKSSKELLDTIIEGIQEAKGHDISVLDLRSIHHAIADYFVVCHGNSHTQMEGVLRAVEWETKKELGETPWRIEGGGKASWMLLDYSNIVVHIFHKEAREFYGLEDLWADAKVRQIENRA